MNRKQFIVLLVLVAVIGGAGLIIHQHNNQSWQSADAAIGQKLLPNIVVNDIAQIHIQSGTNELNLARQNDLWRVAQRADYPADFSKISDLLIKLAGLKVAQVEPIGPSLLGRLDLLPPGPGTNTATLVELKDQSGKTLNTLLLGKQHLQKPPANSQFAGMGGEGWPDGRYVMAGTGAKTVDVISDPLETVQPQPEPWLNKDFLSIEKPSSIALRFPEATNSWKLTRAGLTNEWDLADARPGEKLDSTKISSVTSPFSSPSFNDVEAPAGQIEANITTLTVTTFDGFTYVAGIGSKKDGNYPVTFKVTANLPAEHEPAKDEKPADKTRLDQAFKAEHDKLAAKLAKEQQYEKWVYDLPAYSVDEILKTRSQLLAEVKKEPAGSSKK
jgi:hypothetical protein